MYPNHNIYQQPYDQTLYDHSTPYQTEHYIPEVYDQRISPCFLHKEDLWDHHQDHLEWGGRVKVSNRDHLAHHHHHLFQLNSQQQFGTFAVDPGSIRGCLFRYTYVWLNNRQQFWYFPTFVGRTSISGWRWTGFNWVFFGVGLRQIQSFTCV